MALKPGHLADSLARHANNGLKSPDDADCVALRARHQSHLLAIVAQHAVH